MHLRGERQSGHAGQLGHELVSTCINQLGASPPFWTPGATMTQFVSA